MRTPARPELWLPLLVACASPVEDTGPGAPTCPDWTEGHAAGEVAHPDLVETSGLVPGAGSDTFWAHNDSGGAGRLFALGGDGRDRGVVDLASTEPRDWEDLARGPGPGGAWMLHVGDIGDNERVRDRVAVHSVLEPAPPGPGVVRDRDATARHLAYEDGPHDAETLLVDPRSGTLYVLTKADDGHTGIYRAEDDDVLRRVGTVVFGSDGIGAVPWLTGGDVSPEGSRILLRTYGGVHLWLRQPGEALHEALSRAPCPAPSRLEIQGEAIAFTPDGAGYLTISEGAHPTVWRFEER